MIAAPPSRSAPPSSAPPARITPVALALAAFAAALAGASLAPAVAPPDPPEEAAADAALRRGLALFREGRVEEAEPLLRAAVEHAPEDPVASFYLGQLLLTLRRLNEAEKHLEASRARRPDYAPLHYALSALHAERGELEPALAEIERSLELDAGSALAHYQAAQVLGRLGRKREAHDHYIRVAEIGAPNEGAAFDTGAALFAATDFSRATLAFESAAGHNPANVRTLEYLGACYRVKGFNDRAHEIYQRILKLQPDNAIAYYGLGVIEIKHGRPAEAAALLERSLRIDPRNAYAHHKLGKLRMMEGRTEEAVHAFEMALEIDPQLRTALYNLGLAYLRLGDDRRGREALARFEDLKKRERAPMGEGGVRTAVPEDEL
jgi:superkiller protein 3